MLRMRTRPLRRRDGQTSGKAERTSDELSRPEQEGGANTPHFQTQRGGTRIGHETCRALSQGTRLWLLSYGS